MSLKQLAQLRQRRGEAQFDVFTFSACRTALGWGLPDWLLKLVGDQVIGSGREVLLADLSVAEQRRVSRGLQHPFYWAGIELLGTPW
jgi:CHAT domain-containing protein